MGILLMPVFSIVYSYLSRVYEHEPETLPLKLSRFVKILSMIVFPMIVFGYFLSPFAFPILFSSKWNSSIIIFQIFLIGEISWVFMAFPEAFKSAGKPNILLPINIIQTIFALALFYFSIKYGLVIFVLSRVLTMWIFGFHIYYSKKYLNYTSFLSDTGKYFLFSIALAFSLWVFNLIIPDTLSNGLLLFLNLTIGLCLYSGSLLLFSKQDLMYLIRLRKKF